MIRKTLTDDSHDTLEFRTHGNGDVYVEASEGEETACAGPFKRAQIVGALDSLDPPVDYADGGVTAAAIEAEVVSPERARSLVQERDEARAELNLLALREKLTPADQPRPLTAREHLDAARDAVDTGYPLPRGGTIPGGAAFWVRTGPNAGWELVAPGGAGDFDTSPFPEAEYVLVDPPPPSRPEGAEAVSSVLGALREDDGEWMTYASDKDLDGLADALAERGVRVTAVES